MIFAGNCAIESMGLKPFGFAGGREDVWEPEEDIYWGAEAEWLGDKRYTGDRELENPLAAVQMGLIYVNPEGPNGKPDPARLRPGHPRDLRAHGDERRGDGRADRRRPHLRQGPRRGRSGAGGSEPEGARIEEQGLGWKNSFGTGKGAHTTTSGLEGAWTPNPIKWDNGYFDTLLGYEWELTKSPAGAQQWKPKDPAAKALVPDAHDPSKRHAPMMTTADMAMKVDPDLPEDLEAVPQAPGSVGRRVRAGVVQADAPRHGSALALPRRARPEGGAALAGSHPRGQSPADRREGHRGAQGEDPRLGAVHLRSSSRPPGRRPPPSAAPTSAAGRTAARIRLAPQKNWEVNQPARLAKALEIFETIQQEFNGAQKGEEGSRSPT